MKKSPEFSIPIFNKKSHAIEEGIDDYLIEQKEKAAEKNEKRAKLEVAETEHQWQTTLDSAFQQDNFDLIKTLRKSRPDLAPNRGLVTDKLNELLRTRPSDWETIYAKVRSVSDVEPDEQIVKEEYQKLFDSFGKKADVLNELEWFSRATGYQPSEEQVQAKYRWLLNNITGYHFSDNKKLFQELRSLTGVKPDLGLFNEIKAMGNFDAILQYAPLFGVEITDALVQSIYEAYFEKNGTLPAHIISKFSQKPNQKLVEKVYAALITEQPKNWIKTVQELKLATGVQPQFPQEQVRALYEKFFEQCRFGQKEYYGIENVKEMTGVEYPDDLVQQAALRIIDAAHNYIDQGKAIKNGIAGFEAVVGRKIEIPETAIQERYQQAIAEKKAHVITNLYGAFAVRPAIDAEEARQFMLSFIGDTYHSWIRELEKVFGFAFSASDDEVSSEYDENLSKLNFDAIAKIKELTGKECSKEKLDMAVIAWFEKEALTPPKNRSGYGQSWEKNVKQRLEQFGITVPAETVSSLYKTLVDNEIIYLENIAKVVEITNVPLPAELAQRAYNKFLSPDYAERGFYHETAHAFAKIYKISGVEPHITSEQAQKFYRSILEKDYGQVIQQLAEITKIKPVFDKQEIQALYKRHIFNGTADRIERLQKTTGISLSLDKETLLFIREKIRTGLKMVGEKNYIQHDYQESFSDYQFETDLRDIKRLVAATGIEPNRGRLKQLYNYLLTQQDYWAIRIEMLAAATGVMPEFSPKQVQDKAQKLLLLGRTKDLISLSKYGAISFDAAHVETAYDAILSHNYGNIERFNLDDEIIELQKISGLPPTKKQLARLLLHYIHICGFNIRLHEDGYHKYIDTFEYVSEKLGIKIDEDITQDIYATLVAEGNVKAIGELKKRTKVTAEVPEAIFKADELIEKEQWKKLAQLKEALGAKRLSVTEEKLQQAYIRILGTADLTQLHGAEATRDLFNFLYESTGIKPALTSEQTNEIYKKAAFSDWQKWQKILSDKPSEEVVQHKYFLILTDKNQNLTKDTYEKLHKITNIPITEATVIRALEHFAGIGEVKAIKKIIEITGKNPAISKKAIEAGYITTADKNFNAGFGNALNYFYDELGIPPNKQALGIAYANSIKLNAYCPSFYQPWWKYLSSLFGPPDEKQSDQIYYALLSEGKKLEIDGLFSDVRNFGGTKFNLKRMAKNLSESGVDVNEKQIESQIQNIYRTKLLEGDIVALRKLEIQTGVLFRVEIGETQILYAQILENLGAQQESAFKFLFERSEYSPDEKMIQNKYKEFFAGGEFKIDEMYALWSVTGIKPAEQILQAADESEEKQVSAINFIKFLGAEDFAELFPKTHAKALEITLEQIEYDLDLADYFVENLHTFYFKDWAPTYLEKAVKHYSVAVKFKQNGGPWSKLTWAQDILTKAQATIDQGPPQSDQWEDDNQGYSSSGGNQSFLDSDPYEHHPYRQFKFNFSIAKILNGENPAKDLELSAEAEKALREIDSIIKEAHQQFIADLSKNKSVPNEDGKALTDPEHSPVKMNNLLPNIRNFVSRYIAQMNNGDLGRLNEVILAAANQMPRIVNEGFKRYLKIYEVDIPLYDKLYEEFDYWREAGRYPLEVYLGRDGIYAYVGRHAQDAARRSKLGREGRKKLKERGEVLEINPKYLVYPRYFRDNLNYDTKRQFLEQEGISPDADPLFYDTGYTGTIPEQIMRVMDFDTDDIETRIRLLSAPTAARRVKNIPENARGEIIEYIEHNAKTENSADGLIIDPKNGKIRHTARPTNPEDQFYYMMIKQAIARHYFVRERLHFEPSRAVNFDSEHYGIRIVQEYAKKLPAEFMANPKKYFDAHGTLLRGSKGEGEFPAGEIILFTLDDDTEVVAKRIELRKAKEAKKEFMVLIAAKKAGLSTAEPVGFLSGKEETDGSYLLMEKLEGVSGRNFDKYLEGLGKFTEDQIQAIMKNITHKLEEQANLFREKLNIDKRWRVKDTMIQFNEETGEIENVIPIDWERTITYNPNKPQKIDTVK